MDKGDQGSHFIAFNPFTYIAETGVEDRKGAVAELREIIGRLGEAGAAGVQVHASIFGKALYATAVGTRFTGTQKKHWRHMGRAIAGLDLVEETLGAAREAGLETQVVLRLYDDYFPLFGSQFEREHQGCLWESRDGEFRLRGVLSVAYEEVAEYRTAQVEELCGYDADGVTLSLYSRSAAMTPIRRGDFFGFNEPYAKAHMERCGEDIREFECVEYRRGFDLQLVDAVYEGGDFDREGWHAVKGDFFEAFLEGAAKVVRGSGKRMGLARGSDDGILPVARMELREGKWLKGGVIDDLFLGEGAGQGRELREYLEARGEGARVFSGEEAGEGEDGVVEGIGDFLGG